MAGVGEDEQTREEEEEEEEWRERGAEEEDWGVGYFQSRSADTRRGGRTGKSATRPRPPRFFVRPF